MRLNALWEVLMLELEPGGEWIPEWDGWLVVSLAEGSAYWRTEGRVPAQMETGDVIVAARGVRGGLLASRLGRARLLSVVLEPNSLRALATMAEDLDLESLAADPASAFVHHPAASDSARRFAHLAGLTHSSPLLARCRWLHWWTEAFAPQLKAGPVLPATGDATGRFLNTIGQLPAAALLDAPLSELARRCGCSERHFSRIFRQHFGQTYRERQLEQRLREACRRLRESDEKVITIAHASGFRHLGLFNFMFKRRYGATPSDWRTRARDRKPRRTLGRAAAAATLVLGILSGQAADTASPVPAPVAEGTSQKAATPTFPVRGYEIVGSTLLSTQAVHSATQAFTGEAVDFETVRKALGAVQLELRARGYVTVSATLPQQQLTNGLVKLRLIEGKTSEILVTGNRFYSSNNVMRALPGIQTNQVLNGAVFQAELDRANANRDRQIFPELQPGADPGTTVLRLKVKDQLPLHGRVDVNDFNTPDTPSLRINTSAEYLNLWQLEHAIGLQYGFTPQQLKPVSPDVFLDAPLVAYYSGFYRMPLTGAASLSDAVNARPATFGYNEATRQFQLPPSIGRPELTVFASRASSDTDVQTSPIRTFTSETNSFTTIYALDNTQTLTLNEGVGARVGLPLPEFGRIRSSFTFGLDLKSYQSTTYITNFVVTRSVIPGPNPGDPDEIRTGFVKNDNDPTAGQLVYTPLSLRWDATRPDKLGSFGFFAGTAVNLPIPGTSSSSVYGRYAGSREANGNYVTVTAGMRREQRLFGQWTALFRMEGQWANQPLISNEQFAVGGMNSVRGYHEGEEYGNSGWWLSVEGRTPSLELGKFDDQWPLVIRGSTFTDYGQAFGTRLESAGNRLNPLWSAGVGLSGNIGNRLDFRALAACVFTETPYTPANSVQFRFSVGLQF